MLPDLRRAWPDLVIQLREDTTAALLERLAEGHLGLLLLALEANLGDVETCPVFRDEFVLATSANHPLAARRSVREADLAGSEILLLDDGHCLRVQALSVCRAVGAREQGDFRASSLGTLVQRVAGGSGITLLPRLAEDVEGRRAELAIVPFADPVPGRTIGLARRQRSPRSAEYRELGAWLASAGSPAAPGASARGRTRRAKDKSM